MTPKRQRAGCALISSPARHRSTRLRWQCRISSKTMIPARKAFVEPGRVHSSSITATSPRPAALPPRSEWVRGCRRARCIPGANGPKWVRCERHKCSVLCRRLWGRRLARQLLRAGQPNGFKVWAVIRSNGKGVERTPRLIRNARTLAIQRAARRLKKDMAYFWISEWSAASGYHEHMLIVSGHPVVELCNAIRDSFDAVGLEARGVKEIESWIASVKYVCGDLDDKSRWAEPTPHGFRGRLHGRSRGFPALG